MFLSHPSHWLPFILLAGLISSACAAPPTIRMIKVNVVDAQGVKQVNVPGSMKTRIAEFILGLDPEVDGPTHTNPTHNNPTHNNPTHNNHGKGNHDWTKELKFTDEHDPKVPEKPDDPKQIAYFWFAGGKLCSGYTNCLAYVVVTEGHVPGTTMTVGAVIVVTMDDPQSVTFTVYDHIPSNEREHEDSIQKHQEKYHEFLTTFTYKEEGKVWIEQMADKRDKVLISERLRATLLQAIPLANVAPASHGTHPHLPAGPHSP
ncbi:hypothetical protein BDP27DRAFT_1415474 [Rhodocollybia butyracea]|uniref:Uncharacterized protein n=1 Tax=Rhodocollybia butyracea TaxID=206335 RepID=A0A9P5Q7L0_9AGAR|nr:hypothetical protein BDP27DRAFT_1415474 [Rhodocollybia butyracea]